MTDTARLDWMLAHAALVTQGRDPDTDAIVTQVQWTEDGAVHISRMADVVPRYVIDRVMGTQQEGA